MQDLEKQIQNNSHKRFKMLITDGVFSMDGEIEKLQEITKLQQKYNLITVVDDSHGIGVLGNNGRGSCSFLNVSSQIDLITGTLGKALGGSMGGFITGKKSIIELLRQKSRPYLFSNSLPAVICATSIEILKLLSNHGNELQEKLLNNSEYFRINLKKIGFDIIPGQHPIIPVMLYDAKIGEKLGVIK